MKNGTFEDMLKRVKAARLRPEYELVVPFLRDKGLPNPDEYYAPENLEFVLFCLDEEGWNNLERQSIIDGNLNSPISNSMFDDLERAFEDGEDLYEQLKQRFGE